jgi:glycosyltransferase involved in cell wall biosynthesis
MTGTGLVDARFAVGDFDFSGEERWHVLVLCGQAPAIRVDLASPGKVSGDALATAALARQADYECARRMLIEHLRRRISSGSRQEASLRVSVIVCTHRRPRQLQALVESLTRLDPAPWEVVIVDNDPGDADCREVVDAAGFRYLREDRRGLDNARNAGLRATRGEVVAFIDDDCVASPHWLEPLSRAFAHDGVAAVTGPAFPYLLDTPTREMMERKASLARGLRRVAFDWQSMSPLHAAAMGVGANMTFRRDLLPEEDPFPPELDAGTETESGGDSYLLGRILDAGHRVVYDPEMFVFHQHRDAPGALRKAVAGYGIGLSAALTKLVLEDRELTAPRAWAWLFKQYYWTQRRRAVGKSNAIETRLAWEYLRGGFLGSGRWVRALQTQRAAARLAPAPPSPAASASGTVSPVATGEATPSLAPSQLVADGPAISVIVPTYRREEPLQRCLEALAAQDVPPEAFEVVVVDDDPAGPGSKNPPAREWPFRLRRIPNAGKGAAAARNHGAREAAAPLLVFIDDDVVADPGLLRSHLHWHGSRERGAVLVGPYRPRPKHDNLAAQVARLWWQDLFDLLGEAEGTTFVAALTANVSLPRATFEQIGGFAEEYSKERREDWEWGLRTLRMGIEIGFEPNASARHEFTLGTKQRLRDARREGVGDTLIAATYPEAVASLPLRHVSRPNPLRRPLRWASERAWESGWVREAAIGLLAALEWARFRGVWLRLFHIAEGLAYRQGALAGGWTNPSARAPASVSDVELLADEPIEPPRLLAPAVRARLNGALVGRTMPKEGLWTASLAEQIVDGLDFEAVVQAATQAGWLQRDETHEHAAETEVVFGPASTFRDLAKRAELEATGAAVRSAAGEARPHWEAVLELVREGDRPLVAIPLPGTEPGALWLQDALTAFDGERVEVVFGAAAKHDLTQPLYLHDNRFADPSLTLVGRQPAYVAMRREAALKLHGGGEGLEALVAIVADAFARGSVVGHRECRGLRPADYKSRDRGRGYGKAEAARLMALPRRQRRRALLREASRGGLVLGWQLVKQRGRLTSEQLGLSSGVAAGAISGVFGARPGRASGEP